MNTVIIYASTHHGNTKKIVVKIAEVLSADLVKAYRNLLVGQLSVPTRKYS